MVAGALFGYIVAEVLDYHLVFIVWTLIGSILPDCDIKYSLLGKFNPLNWFGLMKHRGITHTLLAMIVLSIIVGLLNVYCGIMFGIGYFSHLLLDSMTKTSIKWLYPFKT